MKKILSLIGLFLVCSMALAQIDTLSYHKIEKAYGKSVFITSGIGFDEKTAAAQATLIEKKPGKYKSAKVDYTYYGTFRSIKGLPNFFTEVYYDVLDETEYKGTVYVRFRQLVDGEYVVFLVPKTIVNSYLSSGVMLNLESIENEVKTITGRFRYLNEFKTFTALSRFPYGKELKDEFKSYSLIHDDYTIAVGKDYFCELEWAGYRVLDSRTAPYMLGAKVGNSEFWIGYEKLHFLIKEGALVGDGELEKARRAQAVQDSLQAVQDSLDFVRDHQPILATRYQDTVAVYVCDGTGYSRKYRGYCNGKDGSYDHYSLKFRNNDDDLFLQRRGSQGLEIRKYYAWKYDSTAVVMREQERLRKEEEARLEEERKQLEIDSIIHMCKRKQIFIISQEYAYGDYGQFGLEWSFFNCFNKAIKYIEITVKPYNQVDDIQRDDVGRKESKAKCIGPIEVGMPATFTFDELFWDDRDLIKVLKVSYIKITFMDNSTKVFSGVENIKKRMLKYM